MLKLKIYIIELIHISSSNREDFKPYFLIDSCGKIILQDVGKKVNNNDINKLVFQSIRGFLLYMFLWCTQCKYYVYCGISTAIYVAAFIYIYFLDLVLSSTLLKKKVKLES